MEGKTDPQGQEIYFAGVDESKLRSLLHDHEDGFGQGQDGYTVRQAVEKLAGIRAGQAGSANRDEYLLLSSKHIVPLLGARTLRDLTTRDVLDLPIVRVLAPQDATSLGTVATAAAPECGAGYAA